MAHFAKVLNGTVIQVIVAEPEFFNSFIDDSPGDWIQTSYNTYGNTNPNNYALRGNFAGVGYIYDKEKDVFIAPQPFKSWNLNTTTYLWEAPVPQPLDRPSIWNEETKSWDYL